MKGCDLLAELLALARQQHEALAVGDLTRFERLADRRGALIRSMQMADWGDGEAARQMAQELLACDGHNEAALREQLAAVAQELASLRHASRTLRGYRNLAETDSRASALLDRSA